MCRWAAYIGAPIFVEEIVSRPGHSLVEQSRHATQGHSAINADGFGLAWYQDRAEPGQYRDILPAWSDANLLSLTAQIRSHLFLAHVRASTGTATARTNCHPFVAGRWSFMHNGQIGGYDRLRRDAEVMIPEALYRYRQGSTDSEALFLVALAEGLETDPERAFARAVARLETLSREKGAAPHVRLTAAFSDGETLYAVRYATDDHAPSLYHRLTPDRQGRAIVSEPLDAGEGGWDEVPEGSLCIFTGTSVRICRFSPGYRAAA